jgi:uncharacterized membrane protein
MVSHDRSTLRLGVLEADDGAHIETIVVASLGLMVSLYLAAYQRHLVRSVWEPLFGEGSVRVLGSPLSRALPVPDAALGAAGYMVEVGLGVASLVARERARAWLTLVLGLVALAMAAGGLGLTAYALFGLRAACTLCLVSAALSGLLAGLVLPESAAAFRVLIATTKRTRREKE